MSDPPKPNPTPPRADEYDTVVALDCGYFPLELRENSEGKPEFHGYNDVQCALVKNIGDVLVGVNHQSLDKWPFQKIKSKLNSKARSQSFCFLRFRNIAFESVDLLPNKTKRRELVEKISTLDQDLQEKLQQVQEIEQSLKETRGSLQTLQKLDMEWIEEHRTTLQHEMDETSRHLMDKEELQKEKEEAIILDHEIDRKRHESKALQEEIDQRNHQLKLLQQNEKQSLQEMKAGMATVTEEWMGDLKEKMDTIVAEGKDSAIQSLNLTLQNRGCVGLEELVKELMATQRSDSDGDQSQPQLQQQGEQRQLRSFDLISADYRGCSQELQRAHDLALDLTHVDSNEEGPKTDVLKQLFTRLQDFLTYNDEYMVDALSAVGINQSNFKAVLFEIEKRVQWITSHDDRIGSPRLLYFCQCLKRVFTGTDRSAQLTRHAKRKRVDEAEEEADDSPLEIVTVDSPQRLLCPIMQCEITDDAIPVKNTICGHIYSKEGIEQLLLQTGGSRCKCPVAGCINHTLTRSQLEPTTLVEISAMVSKSCQSLAVDADEEMEEEETTAQQNALTEVLRLQERNGRENAVDLVDTDGEA